MKSDLVIIGAGGHGRVVADIALKSEKYKNIYFLDDAVTSDQLGLPVLGTVSEVNNFCATADFFVAVGNSDARKRITEIIKSEGCSIATLVHPAAVIGKDVSIDEGSVIMAGVVINPCVKIGRGVIVNTSSSIDHDCRICDYSHISVGAHIAGMTTIGRGTWVGAGSTVIESLSVCDDCFIGAGSVVVKSIAESGKYFGVPARKK